MFEAIFFFGVASGCAAWVWQRIKTQKRSLKKLEEEKGLLRQKGESLQKEAETLEQGSILVEKKLEEVQVLYHSIKSMGEVLSFAETIPSFIQGLSYWFSFKKGVLALSFGNIYEIELPSTGKTPKLELKNSLYAPLSKKFLDLCLRSVKPFLVDKGALFQEGALIFPLWAQEECVGFLGLEVGKWEPGTMVDILIQEFALEIKKKMLYEKVKAFSVTDSLTGVYLRKYFFQQLELELARSRESNALFSILLLDLNSFKQVNDRYGHLVGDELLKQVGSLLSSHCREIDLTGRYGGDEFVMLLPGAGPSDAEKIKQRILAFSEAHSVLHDGEKLTPSLAVGIASFPADGNRIEDLISAADKRLYENKKRN